MKDNKLQETLLQLIYYVIQITYKFPVSYTGPNMNMHILAQMGPCIHTETSKSYLSSLLSPLPSFFPH